MKIAIGCDPNAQEAKEKLIDFIKQKELGTVTDFGSSDVIYAHVAVKVAENVACKKYDRGILLCGTGIGMCIAANKVKGAYAALVSDIYSAKRSILSNDANVLCMGAFTTGNKVREEITEVFLKLEYSENTGSKCKVEAYKKYDSERPGPI